MSELQENCCHIVMLSISLLGLIIPSIYFGFAEEDFECQQGTRGGLNLSDWLKGFGFEKSLITILVYLFIPVFIRSKILSYGLGVVVFLDIIFSIIWWIWGIVILSTHQNVACVSEGTNMAIMAVIDIAFGVVWCIYCRVTLLPILLGAIFLE